MKKLSQFLVRWFQFFSLGYATSSLLYSNQDESQYKKLDLDTLGSGELLRSLIDLIGVRDEVIPLSNQVIPVFLSENMTTSSSF